MTLDEDFYIGDWEAGGGAGLGTSVIRDNTFTDNRGPEATA